MRVIYIYLLKRGVRLYGSFVVVTNNVDKAEAYDENKCKPYKKLKKCIVERVNHDDDSIPTNRATQKPPEGGFCSNIVTRWEEISRD